jgi:hypothetical protein
MEQSFLSSSVPYYSQTRNIIQTYILLYLVFVLLLGPLFEIDCLVPSDERCVKRCVKGEMKNDK